MRQVLRDNGLSLVLASLFLLFWLGQAFMGWNVHANDQTLHGSEPLSFPRYLISGHFWQATAENWESEFLQMGIYVVFTCFLFQRGSAESKDPDKEEPSPKGKRRYGFLYRNSLSLGFLLLFLLSFSLHAAGGWKEANEERTEHGQMPQSIGEFLQSPEFWFQSFQNWQSEFLAVLSIVVLSIFLRQQGSPESKPLDASPGDTGS